MRDIVIDLASYDIKTLFEDTIIHQGENLASRFLITLNDEFTGYSYRLNFQLNNNTPYNSQEVTPVDGVITFEISNVLTFENGVLKVELQAYNISNVLVKTAVFAFKIIPAITGTPIVLPPEYDTFIDMGEPSVTSVAETIVKRGINKEFGISSINFDLAPTLSDLTQGRLQYDPVYKCLVYGLEGSVGSHQIGQEFNIYARNSDGALAMGTVLCVEGSTGELLKVNKATNNGTEPQARVVGVAGGVGGIANQGNGYVLAYGILHGINTLAWNEGDSLWLGVNGAMTNVKPTAPAYIRFIGWVIKRSAAGKIFVNPNHNIT